MSQLIRRPVDPLFAARVTLCDLLWGRRLRALAVDVLQGALELERERGRFVTPVVRAAWSETVDTELYRAAQIERVAVWTERGQLSYGERWSRHGTCPVDEWRFGLAALF